MRRTFILFQRELRGLFTSQVAWALLAAVWLLIGLIMRMTVLPGSVGDIYDLVWQLAGLSQWMQLFLVPLLTMRLLAEERRSGTFEMLVTTPLKDAEVVLAKWLATMVFLAVFLAFVPAYALAIRAAGGAPDIGPLASTMLVSWSAAGVQVALGLLASALTRQQIVAGFLGLMFVNALFFLPMLGNLVPESYEALRAVLRVLILSEHVREASIGIVDLVSLSAHVALTGFILLIALRILEIRKWT